MVHWNLHPQKTKISKNFKKINSHFFFPFPSLCRAPNRPFFHLHSQIEKPQKPIRLKTALKQGDEENRSDNKWRREKCHQRDFFFFFFPTCDQMSEHVNTFSGTVCWRVRPRQQVFNDMSRLFNNHKWRVWTRHLTTYSLTWPDTSILTPLYCRDVLRHVIIILFLSLKPLASVKKVSSFLISQLIQTPQKWRKWCQV